jgi:hypothetical protein
VLFIFTFSIFVLCGFLGLSLDASLLYFHKRRMQTAADAGAYAGALEKLRGSSTGVTSSAKNDTSLNGFTDGTNGVVVAVNSPPTSGAKAGDANFVEVIISQPQSTWFMRALNVTTASVAARAVAGIGNTGNGCVYALNRDSSNSNNGFSANGTTDSTFSCGVFSNSNFRSVGGACVVTPTVSYVGTYDNHNAEGSCGPEGITQGVPIVDPLKSRYSIPGYSGCDQNNFKITSGTTVHISPGVYCGGISIGGTVANVIFDPGTYVLVGGGMDVNGSVSVTGADVTFFNTYPGTQTNKYSGVGINGSGTVTLTAPTSGQYAGLLFYQDPRVAWSASNGSVIAGGANSVYNGIIYFPSTDLTYSGNSSSVADSSGYTVLIGYNVRINGSARVNSDFSALGGKNPLQDAVFAE